MQLFGGWDRGQPQACGGCVLEVRAGVREEHEGHVGWVGVRLAGGVGGNVVGLGTQKPRVGELRRGRFASMAGGLGDSYLRIGGHRIGWVGVRLPVRSRCLGVDCIEGD